MMHDPFKSQMKFMGQPSNLNISGNFSKNNFMNNNDRSPTMDFEHM